MWLTDWFDDVLSPAQGISFERWRHHMHAYFKKTVNLCLWWQLMSSVDRIFCLFTMLPLHRIETRDLIRRTPRPHPCRFLQQAINPNTHSETYIHMYYVSQIRRSNLVNNTIWNTDYFIERQYSIHDFIKPRYTLGQLVQFICCTFALIGTTVQSMNYLHKDLVSRTFCFLPQLHYLFQLPRFVPLLVFMYPIFTVFFIKASSWLVKNVL